MSFISIDVNMVRQSALRIGQQTEPLFHSLQRLNGLYARTSHRVLARRDLYGRIQRTLRDVDDIIGDVKALQSMLTLSMERYCDADKYLLKEALELLYRLENGKFSYPKKATEIFRKIADTLSFLDRMILYPNAFITVGTVLTGRLKIMYPDGKPGWRSWEDIKRRLKGNYKFTVRAPGSWTKQRGVYSSKIAGKIDAFVKSTPSNPVAKWLQRYASTYNNPSAILKHAAGFNKNVNGKMYVSTLFKNVTGRLTTGSLSAVESAANRSSLGGMAKAAARRLPGVSYFITVAANSGELLDDKKTPSERVGRFVAGTAVDIAAIAAGTKAGAVIGGAIGGPIGVVVGGAVGGVVGAVVSSQFGEKVKEIGGKAATWVQDFGGKVADGIQDFGGKISAGIQDSFRSIKKWFR